MSQTTSGTFEPGFEAQDHSDSRRHRCGWGGRANWSIWEVALIVAAFVAFWPLGLLALFLKLKKGELWPGSAQAKAPWSRFKGQDMRRWAFRDDLGRRSGNSAFDAYKAQELERLEAERRRLADEQRAFGDFLERLKRAKDQEEFDRFMNERRQPPANE